METTTKVNVTRPNMMNEEDYVVAMSSINFISTTDVAKEPWDVLNLG